MLGPFLDHVRAMFALALLSGKPELLNFQDCQQGLKTCVDRATVFGPCQGHVWLDHHRALLDLTELLHRHAQLVSVGTGPSYI